MIEFLKKVGGVFVSILISGIVVAIVESIGNQIFPVSEVNWNNQISISKFMKSIPISAKIFVLFSYFCGSISGGFVSTYLTQKYSLSIIPGLFLSLGGYLNFKSIKIDFKLLISFFQSNTS